jgi:hypothetical protein
MSAFDPKRTLCFADASTGKKRGCQLLAGLVRSDPGAMKTRRLQKKESSEDNHQDRVANGRQKAQ